MYDCEKHIDLVIKACNGLNKSELDIFLCEIVGMSNNEIVIMKKMFNIANTVNNVVEKNVVIENPQIVAMIDYVKKHYRFDSLIDINVLQKNYGFDFDKVYEILRKEKMLKYVCGFVFSDELKQSLIDDVKNNPLKYDYDYLVTKYDVHRRNIYNWLKVSNLSNNVKTSKKGRKESCSMSNANLRAEITAFADNN